MVPTFASKRRQTVLSVVLLCAASHAGAQAYRFDELTLQGAEFTTALGINNHGQIVGNVRSTQTSDEFAAVWNHTVGQTLTTTVPFQAVAINDLGQIAGNVGGLLGPIGAAGSTARAAMFDQRGLTIFSGFQHSPQGSEAVGINNLGRVVGFAQTTTRYEQYSSSLTTHAAIFGVDKAAVDLGTLGGTNSFGYAINSASQVVGLATSSGDFGTTPTLWKDGQASALTGSYPWSANDINDAGQAVGSSYRDLSYLAPDADPIFVQTATLFAPDGKAIFLDNSLNLRGVSVAKAVNSSGMAVGYSDADINDRGPNHGMLWTANSAVDLNTFLDSSLLAAGWYIKSANDINDAGWIVGDLANSLTGAQHGYLLSIAAVPEPSTSAMLIAGGVFVAWRRRDRAVKSGHLAFAGRTGPVA